MADLEFVPNTTDGCNDLEIGDTVIVNYDTDGAAGNTGTVRSVSRYGRCIIDFPDGSFRSIPNIYLNRKPQ